jgi:hypothetical protein
MLDKLRSEPVRVYMYSVLTALTGVLLVYGIVDGQTAGVWLGLGAALFGIPAVEAARAKVTPVAKK